MSKLSEEDRALIERVLLKEELAWVYRTMDLDGGNGTALLARLLQVARAEERAKAVDEETALSGGSWVAAEDVNRLSRQLDVAMNGEAGAAARPALCDVISQACERLVAPAVEGVVDIASVRDWLRELPGLDMDDIAADGGVTVAMVVQQEASEMARRLDRALLAALTPEKDNQDG